MCFVNTGPTKGQIIPNLCIIIPMYVVLFCVEGIIEVELQEDQEGEITLMGYPVTPGDNSVSGPTPGGNPHLHRGSGKRLQRSSPKPYQRGTSPNSSGSENETSQSPVLHSRHKHPRQTDNSYR